MDTLAIDVAVATLCLSTSMDSLSVRFDTVVGVDTDNGTVTLIGGLNGAGAANDVTVDDDINATGDVIVTLTGDDAKLTIASGNAIVSSAGSVTLTADKMDLAGYGNQRHDRHDRCGKRCVHSVLVKPSILDRQPTRKPIPLKLSDNELDRITTSKLVIGRDDASALVTSQLLKQSRWPSPWRQWLLW